MLINKENKSKVNYKNDFKESLVNMIKVLKACYCNYRLEPK